MAGHRRYAGMDLGERYQQLLAFGTERAGGTVRPWERTLGDVLDPMRPGSAMDLVNAVSRDVGADVAGWRFVRVLNATAQMHEEARERAQQGGG